jgi:hypothetical protein
MPPTVRIGLVYTALRVSVFLVTLGLGILVGLHGILLVVVAFLVSAVVSYPLGRRQRAQLNALATTRIERRRRDH